MKKSNEVKMGESVSLAIHFCHSLLDGKECWGIYLDKNRVTCHYALSRYSIPWDYKEMIIFKCKLLKSWEDESLCEKRWVHVFLRNRENGETFLIMILMKKLILFQPSHWEVSIVDFPLDKKENGKRRALFIQ